MSEAWNGNGRVPMLAVEGLRFAYKNAPVLAGVDLTVGPGETVGVVGPNGAGKSTLISLISGALSTEQGRIAMDGRDARRMSPRERAGMVAVVPQSPVFPGNFTALDLVLMGRTPHMRLLQWESESDVRLAQRAMEETGCLPLAGRRVDSLSGGERQRLLVARALVQEAPLLLLDEPTANLDLAHQTGILDLAREAQVGRGGSVLMAIHDLSLAAQYCNRIAFLHEGRVFAEGTPAEVITEDTVRLVYGADVSVITHPVAGTPVVLPVARGVNGQTAPGQGGGKQLAPTRNGREPAQVEARRVPPVH